jgi:hypothetical protein
MIGTATSPPADNTFAIRTRLAARQDRRERPAHAERAEVVHFHLEARRAQVGRFQQRLLQELAGVVHEDRDILAVASRALDRCFVGHVELDCNDAVWRFRDEMRGSFSLPGAHVHATGTARDECAHECFADTAIAAGDERY